MALHNLLVLSDIHLGSDLVQHARPDAPARGSASVRRDRELVAMLDWYRVRPHGGLPWRLVIAGDLVDFVGMSVSSGPDEIVTEPNEEERLHGLGNSADHTLAKLRRVAEHHAPVFSAIARFVAAGNTLVVLRGNHDIDLHWEAVQVAFRELLGKHAPIAESSLEFADWFYYEEGLVYIEHGHQYDDYCSCDYLLHPVLPSDPRRSHRSLADVLLRYVVRPTRGMLESGHESASALDYLRFGARLGFRGLFGLGQRFVMAIAALLVLWREHFGDAARWVRAEHERKMALLAEARQISLLKLKALASLQRPPITRSLLRILAGVMVDRVAMTVAALIGLGWLLAARWTPALGLQLLAVVALLVPLAWLWRRARGAIDASESLRERAARVATLFPAAFVVMGHTHLPEMGEAFDGEATYVNVGGWAEEETADSAAALPASRTHLVVEHVDGRPRAELLSWDAEQGPQRFEARIQPGTPRAGAR
jgi:UDP-2,3-diacylglucosamine pyrophosphatase LpxH